MAEERLVIGSGPAGLRAAATLACAGHKVRYLTEADSAAGLAHPEIAEDTGILRDPGEDRATVERVLGPLSDAAPRRLGVLSRGRRHAVPLARWQIPSMLPAEALLPAASAWTRTRGRNALSHLVGSGAEERTYRDWVVRRMGAPAYHHLYRCYAERRWGAPGDSLASSLGRVHHGAEAAGHARVPADGAGRSLAFAERALRDAGGTISTGVVVTGLRVERGRVVAVQTQGDEIPVDAAVWIARSPTTITRWLGDAASPGVHVDIGELAVRSALQVIVRGDLGEHDELHVLDEGAPFWRASKVLGADGWVMLSATLAEGAEVPPDRMVLDRFLTAARSLGLPALDADGAKVRVLSEQIPVWLQVSLSRLRRVLLSWQNLGVVGVGRAGSFLDLDPAEEVILAAQYAETADPDQREIHRARFDPPVLQQDLDAPITRFLVG